MPIDTLTLGAAFATSLFGGLHCIAMCGGMATGIAVMDPGHGAAWRHAALIHAGRVLGYAGAGALAGGLGNVVLATARSPWLTLGARVAVGVVLALAAWRLLDPSARAPVLGKLSNRLWQVLRPVQRRLLPANTAARKLALGALWGWMPCGLSTTLLAVAWLQADALQGAATMTAFGVGTLPLMMALTRSGHALGATLRRPGWRRAAGGVVLASAVITASAPWLASVPMLHEALASLGCLA